MTKNFKIGSAISIVGIVALVGLYVYLNSKIGNLEREKIQLEREIVTRDAENDSLLGLGKYVIADTLWDSIPVPYPIHDTLPPDTHYVQIPRYRGSISIDTSKTFGPDYDPLTIKVTGKFHFPEQEPDTNWLKIVPSFKKAPDKPVTRRLKSWSIGLNYSRSFSQGDYLGVSVRYGRFTVAPAYDPWGRTALMTVGFDILRF